MRLIDKPSWMPLFIRRRMTKEEEMAWSRVISNYTPSAFSIWECVQMSFTNFFENFEIGGRWVRDVIVRGLRGYSETDTWDLSRYYARVISGSLKTFRECLHTHPVETSMKDWNKELGVMIKAFERVESIGEKGTFEEVEESIIEFKKAGNLFIDRFLNLWE